MTDTIAAPAEKHLSALLSQALAQLQRDNFPEAERIVNQVLAIAPEHADGLHLLGLVRRAQGRVAEAEQLYRRSIELDPTQPAAHYNLGVLYRSTGRAAFADRLAGDLVADAARLKGTGWAPAETTEDALAALARGTD